MHNFSCSLLENKGLLVIKAPSQVSCDIDLLLLRQKQQNKRHQCRHFAINPFVPSVLNRVRLAKISILI